MDSNEICVKEVIISQLKLVGDGKESPYRRILQVFEKDGTLIAEKDPLNNTVDEKPFFHFAILPTQEEKIAKFIDNVTIKVAIMNNDRAPQITITEYIIKAMLEFKEMIIEFQNGTA